MVAIFVVLTFVGFILVDVVLNHSKWAKVLRDEVATEEYLYNIPEVGITMADGKREEEKK